MLVVRRKGNKESEKCRRHDQCITQDLSPAKLKRNMDILERIVAHKKQEVEQDKLRVKIIDLVQSPMFKEATYSLKKSLNTANSSGIIAEHKRKSPSLGFINEHSVAANVCEGYQTSGAACVSILTDNHFFGGTNYDLTSARKKLHIPILRKDFIVDEYQIFETKALGADVMLLIAECLTKKEVLDFAKTAYNLGLEILLEIHSSEQLEKINDYITCVGINNRNLKTFVTDFDASMRLGEKLPTNFIKISESGLSKPETIVSLRNAGFKGFLMGEAFMKTENPAEALKRFIENVNTKTNLAGF